MQLTQHTSLISLSIGCAVLTPVWPCPSFALVAHKVFGRFCEYILHLCGNGQWRVYRYAVQIPRFSKYCCILTTPNMCGTFVYLTAANHVGITQKISVSNKQHQAFALVVRLGQRRVLHSWLLNNRLSGYYNKVSDHHLLSEEAQLSIMHHMMSLQINDFNHIPYSEVWWQPCKAAKSVRRGHAVGFWACGIVLRIVISRYAATSIQQHRLTT